MLGVINNGVDDLKETELRLGLPGANLNIEAAAAVKNNNGKRGFSETVDLKLNLASKASSVVGTTTTTTTGDDDESDHMLKKDHKVNSSVVSSSTDPANPPPKAQVVGWPPVRSFRKNSLAVQKNNSSKEAAAFVKVSVDGAPYLRKVDLKSFNSYKQLSQALTNMFSSSSTIEYVPTYEDKDGDWMLVGDVPWEMFVDSCKRLRMMKGSEAIGVLAPRAVEKCKNRS